MMNRLEVKQEGVSRADMQELLSVSEKTVRNKIYGKTDFTWAEVRAIRNRYFPNDDFEQLFDKESKSWRGGD